MVLYGSDERELKPLKTMHRYLYGSVKTMHRYLYGSVKSYEEAKKLKLTADAKGFTTSYIVAYKNGTRVDLKEALNSLSTQ